MKNLNLLLRAAWSSLKGSWFLMTTDQIVICAWCKKVLNYRPEAEAISHGICFKCHFKQIGGQFPSLPSLNSFAIIKALKGVAFDHHHPTWNSNTLYRGLIKNGQILERARLDRRSLNEEERNIVWAVRLVAAENGISKEMINATEMDGERMVSL